ncbi:hypothetical protein BATDEDRAFT_87865 [Batrachochytrium dendrobatidis JAM81]|uniref:Uncharacterized protein n=1 Tax=Batrachochytrium dendrobatidis (strain JAM81 / FGSC 10211) TaxID=684364 RepID=F4NZT3_BATDJ|nr:uncharacterized protein BATDEDRAFT_87865 [Batrachochytrium dendrobatidis JAM81]EGF81242.1 hypothetical protein BATDEDRAFT_87865 [Batrachochytrium dendrobatidis JAM81]|eukprot:XP_006678135.1 hypothetical protein BATDEDRAFT_87865 [Batrachochytrium dendrobatidis JAM81]
MAKLFLKKTRHFTTNLNSANMFGVAPKVNASEAATNRKLVRKTAFQFVGIMASLQLLPFAIEFVARQFA